MKNKWNLLKKDSQLWEKLKGKETGIGWDHFSRTVTATDDWWQGKIKEYPEAAKFKDKGLKILPEMEILFKDTVASGHGKFAPSGDPKQGIEANDSINMLMTEEPDVVELTAQGEDIPNSSSQRQKRKRGGKDNKRGGVGSRMCDQFDRIIESLNNKNTVTSDAIANAPTIVDCTNMLKQLSGPEYGSESHVLGIRLMKSKSNMETFVALGDPILQLSWINSHTLVDLSRR